MSSTPSATPPATRRIARSYLTDVVAAAPLRDEFAPLPPSIVASLAEQVLERATSVRQMRRPDRLVLTFDLADDPASWTTQTPEPSMLGAAVPAAADGRTEAAGTDHRPENLDYPGQPDERVDAADRDRS